MTERRRYFFGPFCFDTGTEELWRERAIVPLTPKATGVLAYLLAHAGQLASKNDLMAAVWRDTHVGEAVLKVAVREIRRALEDDANDPTYIVTVHRRGYRFVGEMQRAAGGLAPGAEPNAKRGATEADQPPPALAHLPFGGIVPLVGREAELASLERLFTEAASGRPRVVFLRGDAGSGKTALARAFLARIGGVARTGEGACLTQRTSTEPFFSVFSAIASLAGTGSPDAADRAVFDALLRHAPTWLMHLPSLMSSVDASELRSRVAGAGQARMLRELCEMLAALSASKPIVLVIEDAHFADPATLDLLEAVARDQHVGRTMFLVTYRPSTTDGGSAAVDALKDAVLVRPTCRFMPLPPLATNAVERFLAARFPGLEISGELASVAHRRTAGNPLFLAHLSEDWTQRGWIVEEDGRHLRTVPEDRMSEGLPDTLRRMIEAKLAALGEEEQLLLEAAAVAGETCSAALLAELVGSAREDAEALAERVSRRGPFLRSVGVEALPDGTVTERYAFSHGLYRDACLGRIPEARRARLYRAVGAWLESTFSSGRAERSRHIAECYAHGRLHEKAVAHYRLAADEAASRLAYDDAALLLGQALALAEHLPEQQRDPVRLSIAVDRAEHLIRAGEYLAGLSELEDVAGRARALGADEAEARALVPLGSIVVAWDYERSLAHLRRAVERAEGKDPWLVADARGRLAFFELCQDFGDRETLLRAMQAGMAEPRGTIERRRFTHRMACLPMALSVCGRLSEARAAFDRARREFLDHGESYEYLLLLVNGIETFVVSGKLGRAFDLIDDGLAMGRRNADHLAIHALACVRAHALSAIGDHGQALAVVAEARPWITAVGVQPLAFALEGVAAEAHLAAGRPGDALRLLRPEAPRVPRPRAFRVPAIRFIRELTCARAELALGQVDVARERLEELAETCEAVGQRYALARGLAAWARIAADEGRERDADRALRRAQDAAVELPIAAAEVIVERLRLASRRGAATMRRERDELRADLRALLDLIAKELGTRPAERAAFLSQPWIVEALGEPAAPASATSDA